MNSRTAWWRTVLAVTTILLLPLAAWGQEAAHHPAVRNLDDIEFVATPGFPSCVLGAVQSGDPATGPSVILGTMTAGCIIPWHWHSPSEHVMLVSGEVVMEMRNGEQLVLRPGGFALMPSGHVHQARCAQACTMFVYSDAALDIRYVNAQGREISAEEALAAVQQTTPVSR
jgi:quercetin dioxygenase-like cupin family protein